MKNERIVLPLIISMFLLIGCTTFDNQSHNKILNYYHRIPQLENIYWGIGIGNNLSEASENSRLDISKQLYSKVFEKIVRTTKIEEKDNQISNNDKLVIQAELETKSILKNVRRLDYKISPDGTIFVLSYLNLNFELPLDEKIILSRLDKSYYKQKNIKLLFSLFVPGSGQLIDKYYLEGSLFSGIALTSTFSAIYGFNMMQSTYQDYLSANNTSTQQYYYSQWEEYRVITISSGVLYLISGIISALNYESKSF